MDTADIEDISLFIKDYLSMLHKRFDDYYPGNKSEMIQRVIRYVLGRPFDKHLLPEIAVLMGINHTTVLKGMLVFLLWITATIIKLTV